MHIGDTHMKRMVETHCPICGTWEAIEVDEENYLDWQLGALIQHAFPTMSATKREQLITGICPVCWDRSFGEDDGC